MQHSLLLGVSAPLRSLWRAYEHQLQRRPVATQMTTSALLWGAGDLLAQRLEALEERAALDKAARAPSASVGVASGRGVHPAAGPAEPAAGPAEPAPGGAGARQQQQPAQGAAAGTGGGGGGGDHADWQRAALTALFGAALVGPVGHFWYLWLDGAAARLVPSGGARRIAAKVVIDTAALGPFYVAAFFAWGAAFMGGGGLEGFSQKMRTDFWSTLGAEAAFWPFVQTVNFCKVPVKHQLLVVNGMTMLDAAFMSWSRNQEDWLSAVMTRLGAQQAGAAH